MRLPNEGNRTAVVGATGAGKTQVALWLLSMQDLTERPWIVYNFKRESLIDNIPFAQVITLDQIPVKPGVYIVHPLPQQREEVEQQMWAIWTRENMGVFVDEGYMIGRFNEAYSALLTQGRSKRIPMINLSQRPVWLNPFVLDQSEFIAVMRLQKAGDIKNMQGYIPKVRDASGKLHGIDERLPKWNFYYYDVEIDKCSRLSPVPTIEVIYATFARKLEPVRQFA